MQREELQRKMNQQESRILDLKNFLASKDYQTIREMQGGEPMSMQTKKDCADARREINELQRKLKEEATDMANMKDFQPNEELLK